MVLQSYYSESVLQNKAGELLLVLAVDRNGYFFRYIRGIYTKIFDYKGEIGFGQGFTFCNNQGTTGRHFLGNPMQGQVAFYLNRVTAVFGKVYRAYIGNVAFKIGAGKLGTL